MFLVFFVLSAYYSIHLSFMRIGFGLIDFFPSLGHYSTTW